MILLEQEMNFKKNPNEKKYFFLSKIYFEKQSSENFWKKIENVRKNRKIPENPIEKNWFS